MEDNKNIQTPTAQVLADDRSFTVTDSTGRKLTFKPLGLMEQARLARAVGGNSAANEHFMFLATIAAAIREIDGSPVPWPATEKHVDQAIDRLEEHGLEAIIAEAKRRSPEGPVSDPYEDAKN